MQRFFPVILLVVVLTLSAPTVSHAITPTPPRYAQCDECGMCKDTTKTLGATTGVSYYIQPARWQECFQCLYPTIAATGTPVTCYPDELGQTPVIHDIEGNPVPATSNRCDTLLMAPYFPPQDKPNAPAIVPQSGRMFTDVGCVSVDTGSGRFSDPNASVDVVNKLLEFVRSATGGIGLLLVMSAAGRLILSKGDPEKIRQGKKTLTNVVVGVLFSLFALFVFQFFAVQVLRIPGLE